VNLNLQPGDKIQYKYYHTTNGTESLCKGEKRVSLVDEEGRLVFVEETNRGIRHLTLDPASGDVYADYPLSKKVPRRYLGTLAGLHLVTVVRGPLPQF